MKVAIPVFNGRVAPTFDWAGRLLLADVDESEIIGQIEMNIHGVQPAPRAAFLASTGVEILICGGVSEQVTLMLETQGVRVFAGVTGGVAEVLEAFLDNRLGDAKWAMPGWCGRRGRGPDKGRRGRGDGRRRGRGRGAGLGGGTT